jgi:hypothetical protein
VRGPGRLWPGCCWPTGTARWSRCCGTRCWGFAALGVAAVLAQPDWPRLLTAKLVPALSLRPDMVTGGLALLGTTLSSYVYVW